MKSKEELNQLKKEFFEAHSKLAELSDEEIEQVTGGYTPEYRYDFCPNESCKEYQKGTLWLKGRYNACPLCGASPLGAYYC